MWGVAKPSVAPEPLEQFAGGAPLLRNAWWPTRANPWLDGVAVERKRTSLSSLEVSPIRKEAGPRAEQTFTVET